jgi:predicted Zn-dependent protease
MGPGYGANEPDLSGALSALRAGDLDAADAIARRLLADTPNDPAVLQLAAVVALQRGELEQAARAASASLGRRPDHVPTLIIAGRLRRAHQVVEGREAKRLKTRASNAPALILGTNSARIRK